MINLKQKPSIFSIVLLIVFMTGAFCNISAQKKNTSELSKFLILVETTNNGVIKLTCKGGCAWKELTYNITTNDSIQAIDQFGMTTKNESQKSNFIFTIQRTKRGLSFVGIKGTFWKKLSFDCNGNCYQTIDQNGMAE